MREAHWLTDDTLKRHGFRVLSFVFAAYEWDGLRRDDDPDVLDTFLAFADDELSESLVSLAALARAADDELETLTPVDRAFSQGAGWLERGSGRERLSFREACNKILHAKRVEWELLRSYEIPLYKHFYKRLGFVGPRTEYKAPALSMGRAERKALGGPSRRDSVRRMCLGLAGSTISLD
jgi:hypothetical protein